MSDAALLADWMPDIVKLTIVGIAMDPPKIDPHRSNPLMVASLEHLVVLGIATATIEGKLRAYHLTRLGTEIYDIVKHQAPTDGSLPANDDHPQPPRTAA